MSRIPRSVAELFSQYLRRQIAAQAEGLGLADPDGQVVPHEAAPVQPVDPRLAWQDARAVIRWSGDSDAEEHWEVPPDWPALVAAQEPAFALALCIGNFPQMVRNLQPLLAGGDLNVLRQAATRPIIVPPDLLQWTNTVRGYPQVLIAAGVLRLARRFDEASELLRSSVDTGSSLRLQTLWANEEAALTWHRGDAEEAFAQWQAQKTTVPVLFNRGMAALFLGRPAAARTALAQAVALLPQTSAWHHLGHLYLALIAAS